MNQRVTDEVKQIHEIVHALGVLAWEQKECEAKARGGERFQHLQLLQGLDNERVGLRAAVDDLHRCVTEDWCKNKYRTGGVFRTEQPSP